MAKTSVATSLSSKKMSKEERLEREQNEEVLKGGTEKLIPDNLYSDREKKYFEAIKDFLDEIGILGNSSLHTIENISMLLNMRDETREYIETIVDREDKIKNNKELRDTINAIERTLNSLGLTVEAKVKLSKLQFEKDKEKEDPLLKLLAMRD